MKTYNEFLMTEASSSDVRAAAQAAIQAGKYSYKDDSDESRFQFVRDMKAEGFNGNYVTTAWKSLVATGEAFKKAGKAPAKPKAAKLPSEADLTKVFSHMDAKDRGDMLKWKAKAIEMYNIDTSSFTMSQENSFNKAFSKISKKLASGAALEPVAKPTPVKAAPVKETPKSKIKFDTDTIVKKYNQLASLISEIESETKQVVREFNALRNGQHINNLETPDLYRLYLTVEGLKYTQALNEEIDNKLRQARRLAGDAAQYEKTRK